MSNPTPTRHGAWRMIDGQLVNENDLPAPVPALEPPPAETDEAPILPIDGAPAPKNTRRKTLKAQ